MSIQNQKKHFGGLTVGVLDAETTFQTDGKKTDPSPFNPANRLVSIGIKTIKLKKNTTTILNDYFCFWHNTQPTTIDAPKHLQEFLDSVTILVGHNLKFDLEWLAETEFVYDNLIYDTMLVEYVLSKGERRKLGLKECCIRHDIQLKKTELIDDYLKAGIGFESMPWPVVEEYGLGDIESTYQLFLHQLGELDTDVWDYVKYAQINKNHSYDEQHVYSFIKSGTKRLSN